MFWNDVTFQKGIDSEETILIKVFIFHYISQFKDST